MKANSKIHLVKWKMLFVLFLFNSLLFSQENDSIAKLLNKLKNSKSQKEKERIYSDLSEAYSYISPDKSFEYNTKANEIARSINDTEYIAITINQFGSIAYYKGDFNSALKHFIESLTWTKKINHPHKLASCLNNIGNIYLIQANYSKALEYYREALKIDLKYNIKDQITNDYQNIGAVYVETDILDSATYYLTKSLKMAEENNFRPFISQSYSNLGSIADKRKNYKLAIDYYLKSYQLCKEDNDIYGYALNANNIAGCYIELKEYDKAEIFSKEVIPLAKEYSFTDELKNAYLNLSAISSEKGNFKEAYNYHILFTAIKDSIFDIEKNKQLLEMNTKFDTEKKEQQNQLLQTKNELSLKKIEEQKVISYFIIGGLIIVSVLAFFIFRGLKQQRKANSIISKQKLLVESQKHLVEEKHKEITDSINYAERIQKSFLATTELLNENLQNYFVLFQPKDVVSGDFYWATKLKNNQFALVTADSTGHGVPGAIMSILNISSLEKAVDADLTEPSEIFNHTRNTIIERLRKDGSKEGGKDGMDASILCFDFEKLKMKYAAANNPVWIIRTSLNNGSNELIELKPDKMPVGKHDKDSVGFSQNEIEIQKGDLIYTLTDGLPDQFGGPKGKKFMYKQLKEILLANCGEEMNKQKEILINALNNWKQDLEQIDDITIIGVKIS